MQLYPMVFMPGLAGGAQEFAAQLTRFGDGAVVVEPFLTGDLSVDGQARQLAERLDTGLETRLDTGLDTGLGAGLDAGLGTGRPAVVVGHSHGGLVALSLAVQRPDLVRGLVLLDTPLLLPPAVRMLARLPLAVLRTPLGRPAVRRFFAATFTPADGPRWRAEVLARLDRVPAHVVQAVVAGTFTYDSTSRLRALTVPAVCIRANIPVRLDRLPPTVRGVEIAGAGHWPHVHAPDATNQAISTLAAPLNSFLDNL